MGTIECSQLASKSSWDSQDFGDISMVLKMAHFRKSTGPYELNAASWEYTRLLLASWPTFTENFMKIHSPFFP